MFRLQYQGEKAAETQHTATQTSDMLGREFFYSLKGYLQWFFLGTLLGDFQHPSYLERSRNSKYMCVISEHLPFFLK